MTVDPRLPHRLLGPHAGLAALLVVEVAIGFLLFQLAWHAVSHWRQKVSEDSGIAETSLLSVAPIGRTGTSPDEVARAVAALSALPGVARVARTNQVPYGTESWNTQVKRSPRSAEAVIVSSYFGDESLLATLGTPLLHGRRFRPDEYEMLDAVWREQRALPVIITRGLAVRLFGTSSAVGRILHGPTRRMRIVGIVDRLPQPAGSASAQAVADSSILLPVIPRAPEWTRYLVRVEAGHAPADVAGSVRALFAARYPARPISTPRLLADLRPMILQGDRRTALTVLACAAGWWLLTLLSLGAAGILWVQRGWVRISLHRALGASQAQVRRAVRLDHFWLAGGGLMLGLLGARCLLPRLPDAWRPDALSPWTACAIVLAVLALSQLIATWPARRAAAITPHGVTREPWVRL